MTPAAARHYLSVMGGLNLGELTGAMVEEMLLDPIGCDKRYMLNVLQAFLTVHVRLIWEHTTQCPVCCELLEHPENDLGDGESLGHTIDCPLDIGGP